MCMRYAVGVVLVTVFLAAVSPAAIAQQGSGAGPGPGGVGKEFAPEKFQEMKARILKMIDERKALIVEERACVEKAADYEELKKCRPAPPAGPGGHGRAFPGATGQQPGPEGGR